MTKWPHKPLCLILSDFLWKGKPIYLTRHALWSTYTKPQELLSRHQNVVRFSFYSPHVIHFGWLWTSDNQFFFLDWIEETVTCQFLSDCCGSISNKLTKRNCFILVSDTDIKELERVYLQSKRTPRF